MLNRTLNSVFANSTTEVTRISKREEYRVFPIRLKLGGSRKEKAAALSRGKIPSEVIGYLERSNRATPSAERLFEDYRSTIRCTLEKQSITPRKFSHPRYSRSEELLRQTIQRVAGLIHRREVFLINPRFLRSTCQLVGKQSLFIRNIFDTREDFRIFLESWVVKTLRGRARSIQKLR